MPLCNTCKMVCVHHILSYLKCMKFKVFFNIVTTPIGFFLKCKLAGCLDNPNELQKYTEKNNSLFSTKNVVNIINLWLFWYQPQT